MTISALYKPRYLFSMGTSLIVAKNIQFDLFDPPTVLDEKRIPFGGPVKERALDGTMERSGWINNAMHWSSVQKDYFNAWVAAQWGWSVNSKLFYVTWLDESGYYSPYSVVLDRPVESEDYKALPGNDRIQDLKIKGNHWTIQIVSKSANYTVTAGDRLIEVDTTSGDKTLTLPLATTPNFYTSFSFWNNVGANNLIIARAGSDLIDGATSVTLGPGVRADFYPAASAVWTRVTRWT